MDDQEEKKDTSSTGKIGEEIAAQFLTRRGFRIVKRNYREPWGEIDLIAEKDGIVRFVEVKAFSRENIHNISREKNDYRPEELLTESKIHKVARTASLYMENRKDKREFQIDAVAVYFDPVRRIARCSLYEQILG